LALKVIGTGKAVVDLRQSAGGIIAAAGRTGRGDADAACWPLAVIIGTSTTRPTAF